MDSYANTQPNKESYRVESDNLSARSGLFQSEGNTYESPDSGTVVLRHPTDKSGDSVRIETDDVTLEADADELTVAQAVRIASGGRR